MQAIVGFFWAFLQVLRGVETMQMSGYDEETSGCSMAILACVFQATYLRFIWDASEGFHIGVERLHQLYR